MNTEAAFHKHLDQNPNDHTCRVVFADFLQEQADPRAEGYRQLGTLQLYPAQYKNQFAFCKYNKFEINAGLTRPHSVLSTHWFYLLAPDNVTGLETFSTRQTAEDNAARAYHKLKLIAQQEIYALHETKYHYAFSKFKIVTTKNNLRWELTQRIDQTAVSDTAIYDLIHRIKKYPRFPVILQQNLTVTRRHLIILSETLKFDA